MAVGPKSNPRPTRLLVGVLRAKARPGEPLIQEASRRRGYPGGLLLIVARSGYGDVAPKSELVRGVAVLEAVRGQFYVAVLVT